jgi:hypothetical protein
MFNIEIAFVNVSKVDTLKFSLWRIHYEPSFFDIFVNKNYEIIFSR